VDRFGGVGGVSGVGRVGRVSRVGRSGRVSSVSRVGRVGRISRVRRVSRVSKVREEYHSYLCCALLQEIIRGIEHFRCNFRSWHHNLGVTRALKEGATSDPGTITYK
jgi:hypothetical protein